MNHSLVSKKLSIFSSFLIVFIFIAVLPQLTFAVNTADLNQKIEQVRKERETLLAEQKKLEAELESINKEAMTLGTAVKSLDTTKKKIAKDISVTESKINSTSLAIKSLDGTIEEKGYEITTHKKAIKDTLELLSERDKKSLFASLLTSVRLGDMWGDNTRLENLNEKLQEQISNLRETKVVLSQQKQEKEKTIKEQSSFKAQLDGQKSVVEENQKAKERLLAETKSTEALYQKMLAENLARQEEFEADLYKLESELKITLDPSLVPSPRHSALAWPLEKVFVTQNFGKTSASGRLYSSGSHNGVDLRASQGSAVKAMLSGVVEGTGNTDEQKGCYSYGRWILIKHDNGLSSIYSHLSVSLVKNGQRVATGEVIGYSGGTPRVFGSGYSTGPHLHVGLFASQGVSVQQFVNSKHCKQVVVPIADVKAYLDPLLYLPTL